MCGNTTVAGGAEEEKLKVRNLNESSGREKRLVYSPQFLSVRSGWSVGRGSGVVTSSPAAAIWPLLRASYRSS